MEIRAFLKGTNFSEKEIDVYLTMLKLGPSLVSDIANRAKLNRSTTYVILNALAKRGLTTNTERRGVKLFATLPPETLVKQFEDIAKEYAEHAKSARKLLSQIKIPATTGKIEPRIRFFNGAQEMNEVFAEVVSSLETIRDDKSATIQPTLSPGINIYDNRVVFLSPDSKSGMVIESPEVALTLRKAFSH